MTKNDTVDIGIAGVLVLLGTILSMGGSFIIRIISARYLPTDEFGAVVLGISIVNLVSTSCLVGMNQGLVKYISEDITDDLRNSYITYSLLIVSITGAIVSIFGTIFYEQVRIYLFDTTVDELLILSFVMSIPFFVQYKLISGILRGKMESQGFVLLTKIFWPGGRLLLTSLAVFIIGTGTSVALAYFCSASLAAMMGLYLIKKGGWAPTLSSDTDLMGLFSFSLPLLLSSSVFILLSYFDKILIGYYISQVEVAKYEIAVTITALLGLFQTAFSFLLYPKVSELLSTGRESEITTVYQQTTKWILVLTTPAFLVLIVSPDPLIAIFGDQYQIMEIAPLISTLAVGLYIDAVVGPNGEALLGFGRSRVVLYYNLIAVGLNVGLNILLIPYVGILGAAIASMIGYTIMNLLKSFDLYIRHSIPVVDKSSVVMAAASFLGGLAFSQVMTMSGSLLVEFGKSIILGGACLLIGLGTLITTGSVTQEDKELLTEIRSNLPI